MKNAINSIFTANEKKVLTALLNTRRNAWDDVDYCISTTFFELSLEDLINTQGAFEAWENKPNRGTLSRYLSSIAKKLRELGFCISYNKLTHIIGLHIDIVKVLCEALGVEFEPQAEEQAEVEPEAEAETENENENKTEEHGVIGEILNKIGVKPTDETYQEYVDELKKAGDIILKYEVCTCAEGDKFVAILGLFRGKHHIGYSTRMMFCEYYPSTRFIEMDNIEDRAEAERDYSLTVKYQHEIKRIDTSYHSYYEQIY